MKILQIDWDYYLLPQGQPDLEAFMDALETSDRQFLPVVRLNDEACVPPFFIESDTTRGYLNQDRIGQIFDYEATLLRREEYDRRLAQAVGHTCPGCIHHTGDDQVCELTTHRDKLRLDGVCSFREEFPQEQEDTPLL